MTNPSIQASQIAQANSTPSPGRLHGFDVGGRFADFLYFAIGCFFGIHIAVAVHRGFSAAIDPFMSYPSLVILTWLIAAAVCYTITRAWKAVRKRINNDYPACPVSRLSSGAIFVVSIYILNLYISQSLRNVEGPICKYLNAEIIDWLSHTISIVLATIVAIEQEARMANYFRRTDPRVG